MNLAASERETIAGRLRFILWLARILLRPCHRVVESSSFFAASLSLLSRQGHILFYVRLYHRRSVWLHRLCSVLRHLPNIGWNLAAHGYRVVCHQKATWCV